MLDLRANHDHAHYAEYSVLAVDPKAQRPSQLPRNVHIAKDLKDHAALLSPKCNLVLYFWEPSATLRELLEKTPEMELPESSQDIAGDTLSQLASGAKSALEQQLFGELLPYVEEFKELTQAKRLFARLLKTKEQMCPLFHVDNIPLRMLVTLKGAGTEWLDEADARRQGLGKGRNDKIVRDGALVQQLKPFQIALMKGQLFSGHYGKGLIHRSPEAERHCHSRYIFKLDAVLAR